MTTINAALRRFGISLSPTMITTIGYEKRAYSFDDAIQYYQLEHDRRADADAAPGAHAAYRRELYGARHLARCTCLYIWYYML